MSETMQTGRFVRTRLQLTPAGWFLGVIVCAVLILSITIGGYFLGCTVAESDIKAANNRIGQIQNENLKLSVDNVSQLAKIAELQIQIKNVQAKLDAIMPSENTFNISPNQSIIVGSGRLTIGLIGSPTNESVNININGKPQSLAAGTVINTVLDPSTTCLVGVQSFDMFKAILTAWCAAAKPQ